MKVQLIYGEGWEIGHNKAESTPRVWPADEPIPKGWLGLEVVGPEPAITLNTAGRTESGTGSARTAGRSFEKTHHGWT